MCMETRRFFCVAVALLAACSAYGLSIDVDPIHERIRSSNARFVLIEDWSSEASHRFSAYEGLSGATAHDLKEKHSPLWEYDPPAVSNLSFTPAALSDDGRYLALVGIQGFTFQAILNVVRAGEEVTNLLFSATDIIAQPNIYNFPLLDVQIRDGVLLAEHFLPGFMGSDMSRHFIGTLSTRFTQRVQRMYDLETGRFLRSAQLPDKIVRQVFLFGHVYPASMIAVLSCGGLIAAAAVFVGLKMHKCGVSRAGGSSPAR